MTSKQAFAEVTLPDGTKAYVLSQEQLLILGDIVDNQIWWSGAWKRFAKWSRSVTVVSVILVSLALWWPLIQPAVESVLKLVPGSRVQ